MYSLETDATLCQAINNVRHLTDRERQVLALLPTGLSNRQIARHLCISERTVKEHLSQILAKLVVNSRARAAVVAFAIAHDRIAPGPKSSSM